MTEEQNEKMRSTWSRALEIIKNSRIRSSMKKEPSQEDIPSDEEQSNDKGQKLQYNYEVVELSYPPRQKILTKLTELAVKMKQNDGEGLPMFEHEFSVNLPDADESDSWSFDDVTVSVPVEGVFTSSDLIDWLTQYLQIDLEKEAKHLALMFCKLGFMFPCNVAWNTRCITLERDDEMLWKFQNRKYWPSEGHIANETDHARYLLRRQINNFGIPVDDYETEYLSTLEAVLSHKWELLKSTANFQNSSEDESSQQPEQYLSAWHEYAYWKVNRPRSCVYCLGSSNPYEWAACLRGLNRNLPSYSSADLPAEMHGDEEEEEEEDSEEISNDLKSSCKRTIAYCEKMATIDPFLIEDYSHLNPWTNECVRIRDGIPTKLRCDSWELSFNFLLRDKIGRDLFGQHLKQEFSFENLDFYNKCLELRCGPQRQIEETSEDIFNEFISRESNTPVNISEETISLVTNEIKCERLRFAFDVAVEEVFRLMKKDPYMRFLASSIYKDQVELSLSDS